MAEIKVDQLRAPAEETAFRQWTFMFPHEHSVTKSQLREVGSQTLKFDRGKLTRMLRYRFRYGSHMSRTAIIGWRSQSIFGNQLSNTRMKSRPPYSSSHFDIALAMTVRGVFTVVDWVAAANINGTALTSSLL